MFSAIVFIHFSISGALSFVISQCNITKETGLYYVNCSSRGLRKAPDLPKHAFSVDLSRNNITKLETNLTFSGMEGLSYLDLSDNPLYYISQGIFYGLTNLTYLHIRNSLLYRQKDLVVDKLLFGLRKLKHFSFTLNLFLDSLPSDCLSDYKRQPFGKVDSLDSIDTLEIDTALLKWKRTPESKTRSLYLINGFCFYPYLSEKQMDYMPYLENCTIEYPLVVSSMSNDVFKSQKHLKTLVLYASRELQMDMLVSQFVLKNVTQSILLREELESLTLQDVFSSYKSITIVCNHNFNNLRSVHSLQTISLVGNSIRSFRSSEHCFPPSLKNLYLHRNCMSNYGINLMLRGNPQVEFLEASDQNTCSCAGPVADRTSVSRSIKRISYSLQKLVITYSQSHLDFGSETDYFGRLIHLDLSHNDKVRNKIPFFFSANRPNLKYLDMSHCRIVKLHAHSFDNFTELQYLDLSWNKVGKIGCSLSERFYHMINLVELNLSKNVLKCIPSTMFQSMIRIEKIDLSRNGIRTFEADLKALKSLNYLDLSHNRLQKLSGDTIKTLEFLSHSHTVHLNLVGNGWLCTCETIEFLHWFASTKVKLIGKSNYTCSYGNGTRTKLEDISTIIEVLTAECSPKTYLIVCISVVVAICLSAIAMVTVYCCRWRLRYCYYKFRVNTFYQTKRHAYDRIFEYDIFISYSSEDHEIARKGVMDELESKRGLRCCIHERDFLPGESIPYNIARGIRESKRTALFLSKSFLKSEWCLYELNIARMEALHTQRKVMLIIMLEKIAAKSLPLDIVDVIKTFTYLEYPREGTESDLEIFWSKCADFADD